MAVIVTGSLILHGAILGPFALGTLGIDRVVSEDASTIWPQAIDLVLVRTRDLPERLRDRGDTSAVSLANGGTADRERQSSSPVLGDEVPPEGPSAIFPSRSPDAGPSGKAPDRDDIAPEWRVAADALASGPRRTMPDCRRAELLPPVERDLCARRFAVTDTGVAAARLGQRRLTQAESGREEGFAEQAAANEAWARYRRSEDTASYPGLRSMLKHF